MNPFYEELTNEQKCAVLGFAIDFCGCKEPSPKEFSELQELLANIHNDLGASREEVETFIDKMQTNGRLAYAIKILQTIENKRMYGLFYPYFYSAVAILGSHSGLDKLNKIYDEEFGYDKEDIEMIWELYKIKDFRTTKPARTNTTPTPRNSGCMVFVFALLTSIAVCLCSFVMRLT